MHIVLEHSRRGAVAATRIEDAGEPGEPLTMPVGELAAFVSAEESAPGARPRWVWSDTRSWYPPLLASGVTVERCHDLTLGHAILRASTLSAATALAKAAGSAWDHRPALDESESDGEHTTLFEFEPPPASDPPSALTEFALQQDAVAASAEPARLRLLLAAESAGALIAAEMQYAGLPYSVERHDELLTAVLGPRPRYGRPEIMEQLTTQLRELLNAPSLNPDSPPEVLKALQRAGLMVTSTRSWELRELEHPAIAPLLRYKKLSRLHSANGWAWLDTWVADGRFRPDYIPGGVVTGRWATRGGGALQLPKEVRGAVVADPGWKLVVADAAQLEPRILTGLAADTAMAAAGRGRDLYAGIVATGAVAERAQAKVAMLGAMYGATTGDSGRLMPRLARAFPRAVRLVEDAARTGENGGIVTSRLGRSSPPPGRSWHSAQEAASGAESTPAEERRARTQARDWGRFTRNFVVQASAAEWALCWMAELRNRLAALAPPGAPFTAGPHLVYFLHDEVIVHTPTERAHAVAEAVTASAASAGRLLFGEFPVDFPVTAAIVDSYGEAK
ncbi:bifunctional 3'-5' exonuclease/DNA polymerase [Leifsonia shinshuensis]|uniref:bifunctional 3'-5' exonuclease/DNA polymerase n=1 Tax=Leifsonia shinshuensis TaxID=150026 RepID=UPI001F5113BE|nr:bifunctional 3'-5' exonuclease/DNA polymerase [Leifsonia shinshuensis]MCI0155444.1 bifunctional 3'-5' exonuclease/DNA polymerase [Leifsonia shinshuensis]